MQDVFCILYEGRAPVRRLLDQYFSEIIDNLNEGRQVRPTILESVAIMVYFAWMSEEAVPGSMAAMWSDMEGEGPARAQRGPSSRGINVSSQEVFSKIGKLRSIALREARPQSSPYIRIGIP